MKQATSNTKRKEVLLGVDTIYVLEEEARRKGWHLKNYMEWLLKREADKLFGKQQIKKTNK